MTIDEIRDKLAISIQGESALWLRSLEDTEPGHYGIEDWDVSVMGNEIWVDVPKETFTFRNAVFYFTLRIGSSSDEDGSLEKFKRSASGSGKFEFIPGGKNVKVSEMNVVYDRRLYPDGPR